MTVGPSKYNGPIKIYKPLEWWVFKNEFDGSKLVPQKNNRTYRSVMRDSWTFNVNLYLTRLKEQKSEIKALSEIPMIIRANLRSPLDNWRSLKMSFQPYKTPLHLLWGTHPKTKLIIVKQEYYNVKPEIKVSTDCSYKRRKTSFVQIFFNVF